MKKPQVLLIFLWSLTLSVFAQTDILIKDFESDKVYVITTNRNLVDYSLKTKLNKIKNATIISFDSLGIIYDDGSNKPIAYSEFSSFTFKPNKPILRILAATSFLGVVSLNMFIYVNSVGKLDGYYSAIIIPGTIILWGGVTGFIAIVNEIITPKITFNYLSSNQFKVLK